MNAPRELPSWADTIRRKYLRGESSLFILHNNVFDKVLHDGRAHDLVDFLAGTLLLGNKKNIVVYEPARRPRFVKRDASLERIEPLLDKQTPGEVLHALEEVLGVTNSTALIINYADVFAPAGDMNMLSEGDRQNVVTLHRWCLDKRMAEKDNVVFLVSEGLLSLSPMLVSNPRVGSIEIPLPDGDTRRAAIELADPSMDARTRERLAAQTAGLKSVQLMGMLARQAPQLADAERKKVIRELLGDTADAEARTDKLAAITTGMSREEIRHLIDPAAKPGADAVPDAYAEVFQLVNARKREIIEKECFGLIEFVHAKHDFSAVGGMEEIKAELTHIAASIRAGDTNRVPMGLLFVGAMGTGKTFVANAFARASGITALKLKNFRSKWVGSTESNLEKVLGMVKALGPTILIIDEGDRSFGDAGDSDGGTSSRVIARIKEFMSDTENRGRVLFILMTNRPDKLDADIKRAGRLDRKIPFFYAGDAVEIEAILGVQLARYRVAHAIEFPRDRSIVSQPLLGYSNADLEALVLHANELAARESAKVTAAIFARALADYMPSRDEAMLEYMNLLAVFEASTRALLPKKYRSLTNAELSERLRAARLVAC